MIDLPTLGTYLMALLFVLALIGVAALAARRFGLARSGTPVGGKRRLAVVDQLALDGKRRLVLVRHDDGEHLILLGAATETLIRTVAEGGDRPPFAAAAASELAFGDNR